jgi:hypothetical protein
LTRSEIDSLRRDLQEGLAERLNPIGWQPDVEQFLQQMTRNTWSY